MATLTINTTGAEDARIAAAFGVALGLGRNATLAEVKAATIKFLSGTVRRVERDAAIAAVADPALVTPT